MKVNQTAADVHALCREQLGDVYRQLVQVHVGLASAIAPPGDEADRRFHQRTFEAVDALLKYVDGALGAESVSTPK